jgi:hypothetical protein
MEETERCYSISVLNITWDLIFLKLIKLYILSNLCSRHSDEIKKAPLHKYANYSTLKRKIKAVGSNGNGLKKMSGKKNKYLSTF